MQKAMQDGRTSSRQLVEQYLQRIALYNRQVQRGDHRQSEGARRSRPPRSGAQGRQDPRAAARHSDRAQGQHPHHRHPHHRRRDRVRGSDAAVRRDADEEPARRRRDDHRQDHVDRARQLRRQRHAGQLQRRRRIRAEPVRSAPRSAAGHRRRTARAEHRRLELRHRHRRELLGGERRHRDVGIDPEPVEPEHAGRHQADRRTHQPLRRDSDHRRSGHRRADGQDGDRCGDPVRRARRRVARSERPGDQDLPGAAESRLHAVPQARRAEGRAHRHPARELLRPHHAARRQGAARRPQRGAGQVDGRRHRGAQERGRDRRRCRHPEHRRSGSEEQFPAVGRRLRQRTARVRTARRCCGTA